MVPAFAFLIKLFPTTIDKMATDQLQRPDISSTEKPVRIEPDSTRVEPSKNLAKDCSTEKNQMRIQTGSTQVEDSPLLKKIVLINQEMDK